MEITKKVKKQVAPNPTAAIFWLKNRKPDEWRDRKETEVSGVLNISDAAVEIEQFFEDDST